MSAQPQDTTQSARPIKNFEQLYIGGKWRNGRSKSRNSVRNPFTGETLLEIPQASREDLDEAYSQAAAAQNDWSNTLPSQRAEIMLRAATIFENRREEIISWLVRESGSTRIKAEIEWAAARGAIQESARAPYSVTGSILPADVPGKESRVYRKPVGVVGVISPWNWPLHLSSRSVFPALAVGNSVVLKPASDTPVSGGLLLAHILEEAGVPQGVLSVLIGAGREIGDAFVAHPIPRVISFTGSTPVGRGILKCVADSPIIKKVELELGGNSPFVVLGDADIEQSVEAAVFGKFLHQGQICMTTNRFIVEDNAYDAFVERYTERVKTLKYGNPAEPDTYIGPIINERQLKGLLERITEASQNGARQVLGGDPEGLVLPPHVFADVTNDHPIAKNELFGPVAPIIRARDEADALRIANDTEYGLSSAVFTRDIERGVRFARSIKAGMAHVNDQPVNDLANSPFGGEKNSGIGRFGGRWAVDAFTTEQWVSVQHLPRQYPVRASGQMPVSGGG